MKTTEDVLFRVSRGETLPSSGETKPMRVLLAASALLIPLAALNTFPLCAQSTASATPLQVRAFASLGTVHEEGNNPAAGTWASRLLTALAGGTLGAGVGFFASQVITGDWEEEPGTKEIDRQAWAAVGGSVGFAFGLTFPLPGRRASRPAPALAGRRSPITANELQGKGVNNAFEAVQLLRPDWLNDRGFHVIGERPDERIAVYLDGSRVGGTATLREVPTTSIDSIHFLDPAAATFRFGAGHSHGVILIIGRGGQSVTSAAGVLPR